MSATARIMAFLGMDPSNFNRGVDQAKARMTGFEGSVASINRMFRFAFGAEIIGRIVQAADRIGDLQKREGIEIISPAHLASIQQTSRQLEIIRAQMSGMAVEAVGPLISGLSGALAFWKEILSGRGLIAAEEARDKAAFPGQASRGAEDLAKAQTALNAALKEYDTFLRSTFNEAEKLLDMENQRADALKQLRILQHQVDPDEVTKVQVQTKQAEVDTLTARIAQARQKQQEKAAEEQAKMEQTISDTQAKADATRKKNAYDLLDAAGRRLAIEKEIAALDAEKAKTTDRLKLAKMDAQRAELEGQLQGLKDEPVTPEKPHVFKVPVDQFRRIGANVFGGTTVDNTAKKSLSVQEKMLVEMKAVRAAAERSKQGVF